MDFLFPPAPKPNRELPPFVALCLRVRNNKQVVDELTVYFSERERPGSQRVSFRSSPFFRSPLTCKWTAAGSIFRFF